MQASAGIALQTGHDRFLIHSIESRV